MTNDEVVQTLQKLIGMRYVPPIKGYISELTGRDRVIGVGEVATRDFDINRIQIVGDEAGNIVSFNFG